MNSDNPEGYFFFTTASITFCGPGGRSPPGGPPGYFFITLPTGDGGTPVIFSAVRMVPNPSMPVRIMIIGLVSMAGR